MPIDSSRGIVLASNNPGKLREFAALLAPLGATVQSQDCFAVPDVEETGLTFIENALLKARAAALHTGLPALADDSGLAVDALAGAPGIHSARFSGSTGSASERDRANNTALLERLRAVPPAMRGAEYICVLVPLRHWQDPVPIVCEGRWRGQILATPQGTGGFGYDPLFYLPSLDCSAAELPPEQKNRLSHRALASTALLAALQTAR